MGKQGGNPNTEYRRPKEGRRPKSESDKLKRQGCSMSRRAEDSVALPVGNPKIECRRPKKAERRPKTEVRIRQIEAAGCSMSRRAEDSTALPVGNPKIECRRPKKAGDRNPKEQLKPSEVGVWGRIQQFLALTVEPSIVRLL